MALRDQFAAQLGVNNPLAQQQKPPPLTPAAPAEPPSEWDEMGMFEKALDVLNRGAAASAGAAHALVTGRNPVEEAWKGLAGHERKNYSDVLGALGMDHGLARAALGFGADVALDPTTYLTFGAGAGEKVAVGGVEKTLTEGAGVVRKLSEAEKANQAVRVLNRLDETGRSALKGSLLERYGLGKYGDMANQPVGKVLGERATAENLGRAAEGKAVAGPIGDLAPGQVFQQPTLRWAGMPVVAPETMQRGVQAAKDALGAAEAAKGIGPILKGVRQGGEDVGKYLKSLFSASTGNAYLDELRAGSRDTLDYSLYKKVDEYMGKGGIAEHMNSLQKGDPAAYEEAKRQVRGYLEGVSEIKTRQIPDVDKARLVDSKMEALSGQLQDLRLQARGAGATHAAKIDLVKGEMKQGSMEYLGALDAHEKEINKAAAKEAKEQNQFLKDQHELAHGDFKRELKSRGVGQIFGISKDEYQNNIPRQYRRKAGLGIDQWIDELKTRGKLGPNATESEFYDLIKKAHTPPGEVSPETVKNWMLAAKHSPAQAAEMEARVSELEKATAKGKTSTVYDKAELERLFGTPSGGFAMGSASARVRQEVADAIAKGDKVHVWMEGKAREIEKVSNLGMVDKNGNPWGINGILQPLPGDHARIEITHALKPVDKGALEELSKLREQVAAAKASGGSQSKILKLEAEAAARKKELAELEAKKPGAHFDPKIKAIEKEIEELKAKPPPMRTETYGVKKLPEDPKLAKLAQDLEGRMEKVHGAEQRLPLPPEHRENYFPHQLKEELRPAIRKAISQDAYRSMRKEMAAGLNSSQRRTMEGLVDDISVQHLIDSGHIDPAKLKEILEKQGITTTPNVMLAFEQDPVKVALGRELQSIRSLNRVDFAHEILSSPHFTASKVKLGDRATILNTLAQNPDHALYIPSQTYIQHFMDKAEQEALRKGGPHGKAMNLIEEVFAHQLPDLVKTPAQNVAEGYILRKEAAQLLSKAYSNQFSEEATKNFLKLWDKGTNYFKTFQTLTNPGFYTRNMVSYMWQAGMLAGAHDPATWGKAALAMKDPSKVANVGKYTGAEIIEFLKRNGIYRQGYISQDLTDTLDRMLNPSKNPLSMSGPIARKGGDLVQGIDNWARVALTFDGVEKGMDLQSAVMRTKKYLFDMGDFSKAEKQLFKRVIPFYSWTRKSIPLALESMVTQPGKVSVLGKIQHEAQSNVEGAIDNRYVSEFIRDNMGVPISKGADGKINYFLMGRWIPTMDVQRLDPKELFSMLHPLIKEPIEQAMNYNVFSGKPISRFPGEMQKVLGIPVEAHIAHLARNVGVLQQLDRTFFRNDLDVIQTPLTSLGLTTYGQDKVAQMKRRENDLAHEMGELKAAQTAAQAKYGDDSSITQQYVQRVANLQAEQSQIKEDVAKIEPQLGGMKPRRPGAASANPIVQKLQKAAGLKHRAISPGIQKILHHGGKAKGKVG